MTDEKRPRLVWRTLVRMVVVSLVIGGLVLPITLFSAVSSAPLVTPPSPLTFDDAARVKVLLKENNPIRLTPGEIKTVAVSERECNLLLNYVLARAPNERFFGAVSFTKNTAVVQGTLRLPNNPIGNYLNIDVGVVPSDSLLDISYFEIGWVRIPAFLLNGAMWLLGQYAQSDERLKSVHYALGGLKKIRFEPNQAQLTYEWRKRALKQIKAHGQNMMFSSTDKEAIRHYQKVLTQVVSTIPEKNVSLSRLLSPLFLLSQLRCQRGGDAVRENRYVITTLAAYTLGRRIGRLIGATVNAPQKGVTLGGRGDLAKHFMASALLAASAGSGLANFAGVFKEVSDAKGGSGFSFADLLADRAGVKLGESAIFDVETAKRIQARMIEVEDENDFMPRIDKLMEGLQEGAFKTKFVDLDSATYKRVEQEINHRIESCPIYRL